MSSFVFFPSFQLVNIQSECHLISNDPPSYLEKKMSVCAFAIALRRLLEFLAVIFSGFADASLILSLIINILPLYPILQNLSQDSLFLAKILARCVACG